MRYLELLKLSALLQRPDGQSLDDALADVNARLLAAATPLQREIFQTSTLDETLTGVGRDRGATRRRRGRARPRARRRAARAALARTVPAAQGHRPRAVRLRHPHLPQLPAALQVRARPAHPHRADRPPALRHRRAPGARALSRRRRQTLAQMLELLDAGWRRAGFGESERDRELFEKARVALTRYHARLLGAGARSPCGSSGSSTSGSGRTICAGASIAWIGSVARLRQWPAGASRWRRSTWRRGRRRRVRADRLQDLAAQDRRAAARRHPAVAVRARRARGLEARVLTAGLLLRARRPQGAGRRATSATPSRSRASCSRSGRGSSRRSSSPRLRARPARSVTTGSCVPRPRGSQPPYRSHRRRSQAAGQLDGEIVMDVAEWAQTRISPARGAPLLLDTPLLGRRAPPRLRERQAQSLRDGFACLLGSASGPVPRKALVDVGRPSEIVLMARARRSREVDQVDRAGRVIGGE